MRHGDSPRAFGGDEQRELSTKGRSETKITADYIKSHYIIDHILCSSSIRTRQTLEVLKNTTKTNASIEFSDDIYKNDFTILQNLVEQSSDSSKTILLLGHNPSLLAFALQCDSSGYDTWSQEISEGMQTAEIIVIEFETLTWTDAIRSGGKIRDIFIPL